MADGADSPGTAGTDHRRALYSGVGDRLARAFELVAIPVLFGLGGSWIDDRTGMGPVATVTLIALAVIGQGARLYYGR